MSGEIFDESQFGRTVLRVQLEGTWFEFTPGKGLSGASAPWPLRTMLHVISGRNPGYTADDESNQRWHADLEHHLRSAGLNPTPAVGSSPDGTWVEPSWAVTGLNREEACAVGRAFGQIAVFEIEGQDANELEVRVIRCADGQDQSSDR